MSESIKCPNCDREYSPPEEGSRKVNQYLMCLCGKILRYKFNKEK